MAGMAVVLRGWLPHRGEAQMAYNYCFPTRTMFYKKIQNFEGKAFSDEKTLPVTWSGWKTHPTIIPPVGDWTHDLPHTVALNMVKVSHALNHSATHSNNINFLTSPWRLFHVSGSPWKLPISSPCGRECWRPSVHSSWYLSWWYPCISISVFLSVSHLLPPCPTLFWLYGFHLYVWHVHTSVVASASGVLLSVGLLLLPWSLRFFCALSG